MSAQANTILRLFYDLVAVRSDTCTPMERDIEKFIYNWFAALTYFQKNPHLAGCEPVADDPLDLSLIHI